MPIVLASIATLVCAEATFKTSKVVVAKGKGDSCRGCRYSFTGFPPNAACPECGIADPPRRKSRAPLRIIAPVRRYPLILALYAIVLHIVLPAS